MSKEFFAPSRRGFLQGAGAAGLGLVVGFDWMPKAAAAGKTGQGLATTFIHITPDNKVTMLSKHLEMGQGAYTGLATILAEELGADWSQVRVEGAPADAKRYANLRWGAQGTGGSSAISNSYEQHRRAGATVRAMLVSAAAREWKVPAAEISVDKGVLHHKPSGRKGTFGEFAVSAASETAPADVKLKDPKDFTLIGKNVPRVDSASKSDGTAQFTIDVQMPGLLTALVARPPRFGGKLRDFDAAAAKAVPGVVYVVAIPSGVAVVAKHFWAAKTGRDALKITWDDNAAEKRGTDEMIADYRKLLEEPATIVRSEGAVDQGLEAAARTVSAELLFPYLAHAPMEPMDAVVKIDDGACEIWTGCQMQTGDQKNAARVLGIAPDKVTIHTLMAGGSFGRRANRASDFVVEAVEIAKAIGGGAPVKLLWTREDDIKGGYYRPLSVHRLEGGLDAEGRLVAWRHKIVGQPIMTDIAGKPPTAQPEDGGMMEGASSLAYAVPHLSVEQRLVDGKVPVLWWRSVGHTHNGYATEIFVDRLAKAAGQDPVAFRRALLRNQPRHLGVLDLAAEKAGWDKPLPQGRARGIAVHESFDSFVAQVAEITLADDGSFSVDRVVCAVDCGLAINPDVIRAQMEGGIGFGLGAALHSQITLSDGLVEQSNFDDYQVLRIEEMPAVEVHIVPSEESPTGVGEPGVPPIAPAVANAIFAATGREISRLPFSVEG